MLNYFRESLHWIYLALFKPPKLDEESERLTRKHALTTFLKTYPILITISFLPIIIIQSPSLLLGYSFHWKIAVVEQLIILLAGLVSGFLGTLFGRLGVGLSTAVFCVGISSFLGATSLFTGKLSPWHQFPMLLGATVGLIVSKLGSLRIGNIDGTGKGYDVGLVIGIFISILAGMIVGKWQEAISKSISFFGTYNLFFCIYYFRPFSLIPYTWKYWQAKKTNKFINLLHRSPIYREPRIALPFPFLKDWLVNLSKQDRERGIEEIRFIVENRPFQRRAAFRALLAIAELDLNLVNNITELSNASAVLENFPLTDKALPLGLDEARQYMKRISDLAQDLQTRLTQDGQLKVLKELRRELEYFRKLMAVVKSPIGTAFQPFVDRWVRMVGQLELELRQQLRFIYTPNPYVVGNPLEQRDENIFVGRSDIIRALERFILNTDQRLSLLLFGSRRTGKSSTLKNLPRLLSSQFEPVYMDCQDAKWHESDQAFCFNLAQEIFATLQQRETIRGIAQPQLEQFEKNAFTRLDQYLDQFEKLIQQRGKRILLSFDEYEALEESITNADISKNVLGKLRNIIQHRECIVVLVSGSHRFDEMTGLNWASYLINTRTLELSFLDEAAARELLTQPVPKLQYEGGVVEEIIRITHCQPYLLQAVASELVNYLNDQQSTTATMDDLNVTIEKVLVSAGSYFANMWRAECSDEERAVLSALAVGEAINPDAQHVALHHLGQKEMVEQKDGQYQFAVELFRRWILKTQPVKRSS